MQSATASFETPIFDRRFKGGRGRLLQGRWPTQESPVIVTHAVANRPPIEIREPARDPFTKQPAVIAPMR